MMSCNIKCSLKFLIPLQTPLSYLYHSITLIILLALAINVISKFNYTTIWIRNLMETFMNELGILSAIKVSKGYTIKNFV